MIPGRIEQLPDGPMLVRGVTMIRDVEGAEHPVTRPVVAICVCGLSQRAPWCDATHKVRKDAGSD